MIDATEEPTVRTRVLNGVAVPSVDPEEERDVYPHHERVVVSALRRHVRRGDRVVVVGGGWGTTTVVAARMTHFEGHVTTFEPTSEMLTTLERTVEVNRVAELVDLEHAAIGSVDESNERIFGEADGEMLPPSAIPECDVLDLDCEGAEAEILEGMDCRPRLLTVEVHPHLGPTLEGIKGGLRDLGYEVVDREPIERDGEITNFVALRDD